jgi:hypothetical protein
MPSPSKHVWKFTRAGGLDQVRFETAEDFSDLGNLDQKLWVALSCPTRGVEFDERTLALIDTDGDGRVRAPELIAAVAWVCQQLKDPGALAEGGAALPLGAINDATESGAQLLACARRILKALGKPDATEITVVDTADPAKILGRSEFHGDGVLQPESAGGDASLQQVIRDIMATTGTVKDRRGVDGVDAALLARFFDELKTRDTWLAQAEQTARPLGEDTPAAFAALQAVKNKVADYFARCRLAAFDGRAAAPLNRAESEFAALAAQDLSTLGDAVAALPLARVEAGRALPLAEGVNPAWATPLAAFRAGVVEPLLGRGRTVLTEAEWDEILGKFASYAALTTAKAAVAVEKLGSGRIRELLAGDTRAKLEELIRKDLAVAPEIAAIDSVERLARYHRDLGRLLNNFVAFADFYSPDRWATFQAGTLYLDGRSCELCVQVDDPGAHAGLAVLSKMYLAYCDCRRPGGATIKIAACFTQGDSDFLMVGRNGIFYDRKGRDWDATITKVLDNPISIRQAFWAPYKKFLRMIEEQVAKRAATAESASDAKLAAAASATANVDKGAAKPEPKKFDLALITGIGVALGSIGTMLAAIFAKVVDFDWWKYPLVLVGLMLLISLPSMLIAWLKLRQRTLGPVLDANGWAINGRVRINIPLGTALTHQAKLPVNSQRTLEDPYEDKDAARRRHWTIALLLVLALAAAAWWWRDRWWWRVTGGTPPAPAAATAPVNPTAPKPEAAVKPANP